MSVLLKLTLIIAILPHAEANLTNGSQYVSAATKVTITAVLIRTFFQRCRLASRKCFKIGLALSSIWWGLKPFVMQNWWRVRISWSMILSFSSTDCTVDNRASAEVCSILRQKFQAASKTKLNEASRSSVNCDAKSYPTNIYVSSCIALSILIASAAGSDCICRRSLLWLVHQE